MKPVRILVVSSKYPPEYSGSGHRAHRTYLRLKQKFPVAFDVLCSSVTENTNAKYVYEGVQVTRIANKVLPLLSHQAGERRSLRDKMALRLNYFSEAVPTWRFLRQHHRRYDMVHVFGNAAVTSAAITFCQWIKKPLIVEFTYDAEPVLYRPWLMTMLTRLKPELPEETQIVCISRKLAERCQQKGMKHIWCRPNPVETQYFFVERHRKDEYRERLSPFAIKDIVLLNIGKFMPLKNQIFLIDVLKRLPSEYKLFLAGPLIAQGPNAERDLRYRNALQEKITENHLQTRIVLKEGFIDNVADYMKMADVYVLPSLSEGLGTPILESLCCGVPVAANRIPGITDTWIKDGKNGYLSTLEPEEFADKIQKARDIDPKTLDLAAAEMAQEVSVTKIDQEYFDLISKLTGKE